MKRLVFLLLCVLLAIISCSREKEISEGIRLYNEGLTQSALVKLREGLISYSAIGTISAQNIYFAPQAIFSFENIVSVMYPEKHSYNFPREVVSVWYNPEEDVCAVTDGVVVYLSIKDKESIINNPSREPIKAVAHATHTYFISGKELFVCDGKNKEIRNFSKTQFSPPEAFKYYNAYIDIVDNMLIVIVGIAGSYNLWVLNTGGEVLLSSVRVSSWKHFLRNGMLFVVKGSAGNWDFKSINIKTKQEKIIKNFTSVTDIHMTEHGVVIHTGQQIYIYVFNDEMYTLPFVYSIKGETRDSLVIDNGVFTIISSQKFFTKVQQVVNDTGCCSVKE